MKISMSLRALLREPAAKIILDELWVQKDLQKAHLFLTTTEACITDTAMKYQPLGRLPDNFIEDCYLKFDGPLFMELKKAKAITNFEFYSGEHPNHPSENEYQLAQVTGIDPIIIKQLINWVYQLPHILHRECFTLNTLTGDVYYKERVVKLYKNTSYFRLLKSFLEKEDLKLSVDEVLQLKDSGSSIQESRNRKYEIAYEVIKNLVKRLGIKNDSNQVFQYTGDDFILCTWDLKLPTNHPK